MARDGPTRLIFISDVHVGSNYAVFPPDFRHPEDGSLVPQNKWQRKLYAKWEKLASTLSPVDIVVLMGDLTEGPQTREKYGTLKLQNIQHQAEAFIQMFRDTWKWKKLYVVRGTDYHVAVSGMHVEEYIARRLNAEKIDIDRYSAIDVLLNVQKVRIHAAHHVGVSQVPHYRFTPLAREMWLGKLFDDYFRKIDLVARGHVHYFLLAQIENIMRAFTCPAWQLPTPYQRKRTVFGSNPSIGLVEVIIDGREIDIIPHLCVGFMPRSIDVRL
jgi:hypothetical protein